MLKSGLIPLLDLVCLNFHQIPEHPKLSTQSKSPVFHLLSLLCADPSKDVFNKIPSKTHRKCNVYFVFLLVILLQCCTPNGWFSLQTSPCYGLLPGAHLEHLEVFLFSSDVLQLCGVPGYRTFLDKVCVDQSDELKKREGIGAITAFLSRGGMATRRCFSWFWDP